MNKMERKFGRYAIPNLMYYIVILYAVGVLVQMMAPAFYIQYLMLDARAILHGQIWRVVTFMIWPPSGSLFFNLIADLPLLQSGNDSGAGLGNLPV